MTTTGQLSPLIPLRKRLFANIRSRRALVRLPLMHVSKTDPLRTSTWETLHRLRHRRFITCGRPKLIPSYSNIL